MQIISPQQTPGLLQNDIVCMLIPPNTREPLAIQEDWDAHTRHFSFYQPLIWRVSQILRKQFQRFACVSLCSLPPVPHPSPTSAASPSPPSLPSQTPAAASDELKVSRFFLAIVACFGGVTLRFCKAPTNKCHCKRHSRKKDDLSRL